MKYYTFLLLVVMILSFQNCSSAGSGGGNGVAIQINDISGGGVFIDEGTDTGNGGNPNTFPVEYITRLDAMVQLVCKVHATEINISSAACINTLKGDIDFINLLTAENFVDYDDYNYKLVSNRVGFQVTRYEVCMSYIEQNIENIQVPVLHLLSENTNCSNSILVINE